MSLHGLEKAKNILKLKGLITNDPWDVVHGFETLIANYCGSKYAISLDNCTNGIFLCLNYLGFKNKVIEIPSKTYLSVPQVILQSENIPKFIDKEWSGIYQLGDTSIYDAAGRMQKNMFLKDTFMCLSFHIRKNLPIGKGGMILTDSLFAYNWMYKAVYEGRDRRQPHDEINNLEHMGWNMYMTPEQAAYGIELFNEYEKKSSTKDCTFSDKYVELKNFDIFKRFS
tara:strand:- start:82 stop:759 length:678 start_codon:yes stop_codon:yes gene_type:complete